MLSTKADPLTAHKENESPDEFFIKDSKDDSNGFSTKSSSTVTVTVKGEYGNTNEGDSNVYTLVFTTNGKTTQEQGSKNNNWKLEAVKGYLQNEQENMSGWWKNLSTNSASDFTTAHLDFI